MENWRTLSKTIGRLSKDKHLQQTQKKYQVYSDPVSKDKEFLVSKFQIFFCHFRFAKQVTDLSQFLPYIIPTVVQRLGQPEIVESCEELRLYIVEMLCSVVEICREKVGAYIDDMIKILQRTLVDPFHDVRKVSQSSY